MFKKIQIAIEYLLHRRKLTVLGDEVNTEWMDPVQECYPTWTRFQVLKDGLAVHWCDKELQVIQGYWRISEAVKKGSVQCRSEKPTCALLTATGMTCYEIMEKAYLERGARC